MGEMNDSKTGKGRYLRRWGWDPHMASRFTLIDCHTSTSHAMAHCLSHLFLSPSLSLPLPLSLSLSLSLSPSLSLSLSLPLSFLIHLPFGFHFTPPLLNIHSSINLSPIMSFWFSHFKLGPANVGGSSWSLSPF